MQNIVEQSNGTYKDIITDYRKVYSSGMLHHHKHNHYEISLIISGELKILFEDSVHNVNTSCLVLSPPGAAHCMMLNKNILYERININFYETFIENYIPEWQDLLSVFDKKGSLLLLSEFQTSKFLQLANEISTEKDRLRQRLMLLLFLSHAKQLPEVVENNTDLSVSYVTEALNYLHTHYKEKIVAEELAHHLGVSRTTLMTGFKKITGSTLNEYLTRFRLQEAVKLLRKNYSQQSAAELCGFSDASNLIRCFKRYFQTTPYKYLNNR